MITMFPSCEVVYNLARKLWAVELRESLGQGNNQSEAAGLSIPAT